MLHALRRHWRGFETDEPDVTMFIGPSPSFRKDGTRSIRPGSMQSAMLGVSKQAAQRKYADKISA